LLEKEYGMKQLEISNQKLLRDVEFLQKQVVGQNIFNKLILLMVFFGFFIVEKGANDQR